MDVVDVEALVYSYTASIDVHTLQYYPFIARSYYVVNLLHTVLSAAHRKETSGLQPLITTFVFSGLMV